MMSTGSLLSRRRQLIVAMMAVCISLSANAVRADPTLWYNGDFNEVSGLANSVNTYVSQAAVYDDFIVPTGQVWTITGAFSRNLMDITVSSAHWEIRSGVSVGDGGTLIASGDSAATQTATGLSGFNFNEYTVAVSGLNVELGAGTYWLTVNPTGSGAGNSYISTTSGDNAIGTPAGNDDQSYFSSTYFGDNFDPASNFVSSPADFSMGVSGNFRLTPTPEPSTLVHGMIGLFGILGFRRVMRVAKSVR